MKRMGTALVLVAALQIALVQPVCGQSSDYTFGETDDDDDATFTWLVLATGVVVCTAPFWGPFFLTGDSYSESAQYLEYPYKHDALGHIVFDPPPNDETYNWTLRPEANYAESFSHFSRLDLGMQLEGVNRIGADTGLNYWHETDHAVADGDFWTGDANLLFRFAQGEWMEARVGVGGNWLSDRRSSECGFNFTYKADVFLIRPLILAGELDWGTLGDETLFHPRVTLGVHWHLAEVFLGCDYFDIGPTQVTSLIAGGRVWY